MTKYIRYVIMGLGLLLSMAPIALWNLSAVDAESAHEAATANLASISGSFTVINPARAVTIELRRNTADGALASLITIPITTANVSTPANFAFNNVTPGTYSLVFRQPGHTSFTINDIAMVIDGNVDISQNPNFPQQLPLYPGDVNGDGQINVSDLTILLQHWLRGYVNANFTGSGQINVADINLLLQNWMGESVVVQATSAPTHSPTPSPAPLPMPTPTPQPTPAPMPTPTPQPTPTPMPTPTPVPQHTPAPPLTAIPNRPLTLAERDAWIRNYYASGGVNSFELELLRLVNMERENAGIAPLSPNPALMMSARFKAQSMLDLGYFGSVNPHYGVFPNIPRNLFGFTGNLLGGAEHIMRWYPMPQTIVERWMSNNSQRANILNPYFVETGIGVINTGTGAGSLNNFWVMSFVETEEGIINPPDIPQSQIQIPNRRLTQAEIDRWIYEYHAMGGGNRFEYEVLRLTNIERVNAGLEPLRLNPTLMMAARFKAHSMTDLNYFGHVNPIYRDFANITGIPQELFNIEVRSENLAIWHRTPQEVVEAWMLSPPHRAVILNPALTELGVGFHRDRWVQNFI